MRVAYVLFALLVCSSIYAQNKIDLSHQTSPVYVVNLPDVQAVGGTVSVGNLPLDAAGAVRVTGGCPTTPPLVAHYVDLTGGGPLTIPANSLFISESVEATGYGHVGFLIEGGPYQTTYIRWSWINDVDWFAEVQDPRNGAMMDECYAPPWNMSRVICVVSGSWVRFELPADASGPRAITALGVYLMP